ncbi:MAG TPA: hypothetical protein VEX18_07515 [Polyangiaceae bacterium]|nr:hypothetical protein [Polyangiaceae bacterium]
MASSIPRGQGAMDRRRRLGRRVGTIIFTVIFAGATLMWTIQILTAVWSSAPPSPAGCSVGTARLEQAIARARHIYQSEAGAEDERAALARFRSALLPEWTEEKAIKAACEHEEAGKKRLKDVIALRYAEEHAVRYESLGLAPQRRRLGAESASPP